MNSPTAFWVIATFFLGAPFSWAQTDRLLEPARHPEPNPLGEEVSTTTPSETKTGEDLDGIPVYSPREGDASGVLPAYQPYSDEDADGLPDGGTDGLPNGSNKPLAKPGAQQGGQSEAESLIEEGKKALGSLSSGSAEASRGSLPGPLETFAAPEESEEAVLSFGAGGGLILRQSQLFQGQKHLGKRKRVYRLIFQMRIFARLFATLPICMTLT